MISLKDKHELLKLKTKYLEINEELMNHYDYDQKSLDDSELETLEYAMIEIRNEISGILFEYFIDH